jgi:penicillin-binding protein-related factor A (putative recombinase)
MESTKDIPSFSGGQAGKKFEEITLQRLKKIEDRGEGCFGRYGVQFAVTGRNPDGTATGHVMQSLPDFEGVLSPTGRHVIWDNKVTSQASFDLSPYRMSTKGKKRRQFEHMMRRSVSGAICGFLIHWNERETKTRKDKAITYWLPIHASMRLWREFDCGELKTLRRDHCEAHGYEVEWNKYERERKYRPDLLGVLKLIDCL